MARIVDPQTRTQQAAPLLVDEPQQAEALQPYAQGDIVALMERFASQPGTSVETLERLMALWERNEARRAEAAFNAAMNACQKAMRSVGTDSYNTQTKSRYASYEALDAALRPIYTQHGFSLSFDSGESTKPEHVMVLCYVSHVAEHSRTYRLEMPADGKGAKGGDVMTRTHATGSGLTYGRRYLLQMIFNVSVGEKDDDGNGAGGGKAEGESPENPAGFDAWVTTMEAAASKGTPALMKAFNDGAEPIRLHLVRHHKASWEALKVRAAENTKQPQRGVR